MCLMNVKHAFVLLLVHITQYTISEQTIDFKIIYANTKAFELFKNRRNYLS